MKTGTDELRSAFLEFFKSKNHTYVKSDSLVPQNDPSLLFTGAGMNQFKEYFLGVKKDLKRAATSQKCLRTGDLDEVGKTPFHHSFFEMLGNFSFGDYFKKDAIAWAWEFLTVSLGIDKNRLRVTVHKDDSEAFDIWTKEIGLPKDWLFLCGDKSNFWPANAPSDGPNGPCGPCSEIYYDQNPQINGTPIDNSGKYAEIWNLVFTQYDRQDGGKLVPLAQKNIDTGMGLERLACVLQSKTSNFEIDIFQPIHQAILKALSIKLSASDIKKIYPISDHLRAVVFSIADGVIPSNEGRGYVIRKLIRRAFWRAYELLDANAKQKLTSFLHKAVLSVADVMKKTYPEIHEAQDSIQSVLSQEEERFAANLKDGLGILSKHLQKLEDSSQKVVPGKIAFELYDTYGFPVELTRDVAEQKKFVIDFESFEKLMEEQRARSKEGSKISAKIFASSGLDKIPSQTPPTNFQGYDTLETTSKILWYQTSGKQATVILDTTPFYAESGGQVGDKGIIEGENFKLKVFDTKKLDRYFLHQAEITNGEIRDNATVNAKVEIPRRENIMRNHTATHLLHAALRETLGVSVRQLGSLVTPERFRFDFSFGRALADEEIQKIETIVNREILKCIPVKKETKTLDEAKKGGALAFFGDKYDDSVRMITIPGFSKELCGGTHCDNTGQIGSFVILSESSVASGVRRIEAFTGNSVLDYIHTLQDQLSQISKMLKVSAADIPTRIGKMLETAKAKKKSEGQNALNTIDIKTLAKKSVGGGEVKVFVDSFNGIGIDGIRELAARIREETSKLIFVIAAIEDEKLSVITGVTSDIVKNGFDARVIFKTFSGILGINGGGKSDIVQAGGAFQGDFLLVKPNIEKAVLLYLKEKGI